MIITDLEKVARDWLTKSPMAQAVKVDKNSKTFLVILFKGKDRDYLQIEAVLASTGETTAGALENFLRNLGRAGDGRPRACIPVRLSLGETDTPFQIVSCGDALRFDFYERKPSRPAYPLKF